MTRKVAEEAVKITRKSLGKLNNRNNFKGNI